MISDWLLGMVHGSEASSGFVHSFLLAIRSSSDLSRSAISSAAGLLMSAQNDTGFVTRPLKKKKLAEAVYNSLHLVTKLFILAPLGKSIVNDVTVLPS